MHVEINESRVNKINLYFEMTKLHVNITYSCFEMTMLLANISMLHFVCSLAGKKNSPYWNRFWRRLVTCYKRKFLVCRNFILHVNMIFLHVDHIYLASWGIYSTMEYKPYCIAAFLNWGVLHGNQLYDRDLKLYLFLLSKWPGAISPTNGWTSIFLTVHI